MRNFFAFLICPLLALTFLSCGEISAADSLVMTFTDAYGAVGTVYSPRANEGDAGYMSEGFFETLYSASPDLECDFAVFLSHSPTSPEECAVFITHDDTSRLYVYDTVMARVDFLKDLGFGESAVVIVRGGVVFYSTLLDSERAERIWRDMRLGR